MHHSVKTLNNILDGKILATPSQENNKINDFEYIYGSISDFQTAFISIPKRRWKELIGKDSRLNDGNSYINLEKQKPGLIITEEEYDNSEVPQIIVSNIIEAMKKIAFYMRGEYKNPLIAITGSNGKSSTRIMLGHLLSEFDVFQNRGNSNTRSAIWLNLCKLIKNPDYAVFEISLNALNNLGNMSLIVKPDIAVVTNIGEAHLSTLKNTKSVAEFKSRIFEGVSEEGTIILNDDTLHSDYLYEKAAKYSNNIMRYSIQKSNEFIQNVEIKPKKKFQEVKLMMNEQKYTYKINLLGTGMVENSLAAILVLRNLKIEPENVLNKLSNYKSLPKVMEINSLVNRDNMTLTMIDDTHNASLPSYINAVESFNQQAPFFKGNKVLVLGKISDMGDESNEIHNRLVSLIENSTADYILCVDEPMRPVSAKVRNKKIVWYKDEDLLLKDISFFLESDSLLLFKSSVTGSVLPRTANKFSHTYKVSRSNYNKDVFQSIGAYSKSSLILDNGKVIFSKNIHNSGTVEGINLLIYYIRYQELLRENKVNLSRISKFKTWPTNDNKFNESTKMTIKDLIDEIRVNSHPTLIYELSRRLFKTPKERENYINKFITKNKLSSSSSLNRTGRFRMKERQNFTVNDLQIIALNYKEYFEDSSYVFGDQYYHGIILENKTIGCFTSYSDYQEVKKFIDTIKKGEYINEFKFN